MLLATKNPLFEASVDTTPDFWSLPESAAVAWSPVLHAAEPKTPEEEAYLLRIQAMAENRHLSDSHDWHGAGQSSMYAYHF